MVSRRLIARFSFLLSLLATPAVVFACGGGEAPTATPAAAAPATATATRVAGATATTVAAPTKTVGQPSGEARLAMAQVRELFGDPPISPYASTPDPEQLGITESLFVYSNLNPMAPNVADSWQVSADGLTLTLKLKKGVKFNTPPQLAGKDFGELTAADVAWNMNRQNAGVNLQIRSGLGAQFGATFKEARAVDATTVEAPLVTQIVWGFPLSEFVIQDADLAIMSKAAYEQLGADAVKLVPIGTGSFVIGQWVPNERGTVEAVPNHWSKTAGVAKFTVLQVPEITSRIAMLETGQVQFAEMDFAKVKELRSKGLDFLPTQSERDTENASVIWPGNLWEVTHPRTGAALEPWKSVVYAQDYPWIGNPWGDKAPYTDTDNPQGMSDMEQARLVRWALSYAIDRDGIVEKLQSGLGSPLYIEYMGP
ncbi:MAG: hypothetical protein HY678_01425, partial [Chloroflexi bacterium]|nr:hypothetical protein [Chloroflexota bacterium]